MPSGKIIPFPTQTARFSVVVARCGAPAVHLTLVPLQKDAELQRLDRQTRVLTVRQAHRGAGTDYGVVGLFAESGAQLLVFPKSLRRFAGRRIVGINYDLLTGVSWVTGTVGKKTPVRKTVTAHANPAPVAAPEPAKKAAAPPEETEEKVEPLTLPQILSRLQAVNRLLHGGKHARARTEVSALVQNIRRGLEAEAGHA
jgi:hypothetical protein